MTSRLIIGISGASGVIYGIRMLEALRQGYSLADPERIETHLILTSAAKMTITQETDYAVREVESLADVVHSSGNIGASIASGSFDTMGMIVAPCSIKTLSGIAHSYNEDLITRAADVQLKEGRPVLLLLRETPLHMGHLRLMLQAAENGAIIMPPVPAFYGRPQTVDEIINSTVGRALARIGVKNQLYFEWLGMRGSKPPPEEEA
jgi:4-hydroxy-3-polyprenylbenzoate decarboxylase